jgi:SAM-dependent methyltransferase
VWLRLRLRLLKADEFDALLPRSGLIIDCGSGFGLLGNYLALRAPDRRVLGIDADSSRVAVSQMTVGDRPNVEFLRLDLTSAPLPRADGAVMTDFLHHLRLPEQRRVLQAIGHALGPGGVLLIREVNPEHSPRWKYWCSVLAELLMYPSPNTIKLQNRKPSDLAQDLESLGFAVNYRQVDRGSPFAAIMYVCRKHA